MGSSEKFCLRWNDFEANISSAFRDLKEEKDFSDVTLVCADQQVEAHKVILAASSPFFKRVLRNNPHTHPLIYMKGVKFSDLEAVLSFVYHGEVNVAEADLNNFLAFAEELEVKGLTCGKNLSESSSNHMPQPHSIEPQFRSNQQHQRLLQSTDHNYATPMSVITQPTAPLLPQSPAQVGLQNPMKTEQEWSQSASENNNADGALHVKGQSESSQLVNTSQAIDEEVDQYAGYQDFNQEREQDFDLNNYIEKIGVGVLRCNICGHVSSYRANLKKHVESKHFPGVFEYSCDQCEKKFNTMEKYIGHCKRHHSNTK